MGLATVVVEALGMQFPDEAPYGVGVRSSSLPLRFCCVAGHRRLVSRVMVDGLGLLEWLIVVCGVECEFAG